MKHIFSEVVKCKADQGFSDVSQDGGDEVWDSPVNVSKPTNPGYL